MEPWVAVDGVGGPPPQAVRPPSAHPLQFSFAQAFGERGADQQVTVQEADMISAVQFNQTGDMIATGDKGGRVVILRQVETEPSSASRNAAGPHGRKRRNYRRRRRPDGQSERVGERRGGGSGAASDTNQSSASTESMPVQDDSASGAHNPEEHPPHRTPVLPPEFRFWTQFQSHEPEFDYLKSMEIEEKINQIRWCRRVNGAHRLISTNDKTIKLWRIAEREVTAVADFAADALLHRVAPRNPRLTQTRLDNHFQSNGLLSRAAATGLLTVPRIQRNGTAVTATSRRSFSNAHAYHINSLSINSDDETFLSADDLRINLWNIEVGGAGFNTLDIKPENMEDLAEVITAAEFHSKHCELFMYSTSKGAVKLCDMRESALCHGWVREFEGVEDGGENQSFFSEIIASISDVKFSPCGRYVTTRDYTTLKLWDLHMEKAPLLSVPVHESIRSRLCDLYENDCIFDKFQCAFSADGGSIVTGSYNALLQSYSTVDGRQGAVETSVDFVSGATGRNNMSPDGLASELLGQSPVSELVDPTRRVMHLSLSSKNQTVAAATGPALYIYYA